MKRAVSLNSSILVLLLLFVFDSRSFVYPDRPADLKRTEGGEVAEEEEVAMIRELEEEMQRRRDASQLEEMIRSLVRRRFEASENNRKKKSQVEEAGDRVDLASSNKYVRKAYDEDSALPPFPDYFSMPRNFITKSN